MDIANAVKTGVKPNFMISLLVALVVIALVNSLLPAQYKVSRLFAGLWS